MLTEFEQLKKELKPLFEKAFYGQFNSHNQGTKTETNALFQAASNEEQLTNVLKVLDYHARGEEEIYDNTNVDAIYSKLVSEAQSNNDWRISGTYSDTNAANEAADIKNHLIKPPPAPVSAIAPAPAVRNAGHSICAPRAVLHSGNVTPSNKVSQMGPNASQSFTQSQKSVNPLGPPKGAVGSSKPADSNHSLPKRSTPRVVSRPTDSTAQYRSVLHNKGGTEGPSSGSVLPTPPKGAAGYKAGP